MNEFKAWPELTELEQLACEYSDYFKSAYGYRPRHVDTTTWTVADFEQEFDLLGRVCAENEQQRKIAEEKAAHDFELRVQSLLLCGAKDRGMAIRWIAEAEGAERDPEYLCFLLGLDYGYFAGDFF